MKKNLFFIFVILLSGITTVLQAVPAYPHPSVMKQPNGDTLTVRIKGDERINWYETMDGYTLLFNKAGYLSYAQLDENEDLQPSEIIATSIENRNSAEKSFLNTIEKRLFYSDMQTQLMLNVRQIEEDAQTRNTRGVIGQYKTLCAFVQFPEKAMTIPMSRFESLMNQLGYTANGAGSVRDYFRESSYNQFDLIITLCGVYTAPNSESYYSGSNGNANCQSLARWLAQQVAAEPDINFEDYDSNDDGVVDGFHFIFAGMGREASGGPETIWSHKWQFSPAVTQNGKSISIYSCSPEYLYSSITTIGVICHEMTHAYGAMDFYDTDYETGGQYEGTGDWDMMAGGTWNNNGNRPAHHNPYVKTQFGWLNPIVLNEPITIDNMPNTTENPIAFRINTTTNNEYFLLENRQKVKFDAGIPGEGMIIYRVHSQIESAFYMNVINATHPQRMYPVSANAPVALPVANPESYGEINSYSCPWPGGLEKTEFTDNTIPAMVSWANAPTNKPITNIANVNGMISFDFMGGGTSGIHLIFASAGINGTISPSGIITVTHGASQTFTFSANTGYEIEKVLIDGIPIPDFSSGTYTFTNVTKSHAIYVSCVKPIDFFCGGDGTENDPYQICDLASFMAFRDYVNADGSATSGKYYILTQDIDLTDAGDWIRIYNFGGNFDGNNNVVKNLYISNGGQYCGLFGYITNSVIKNLGVENCNVNGGYGTGALVGNIANNSSIVNCYSTGTVTGIDDDYLGAYQIGGLVGDCRESTIKNCYSTCNVTGESRIGGLVGTLEYLAIITNCYATGNVTGVFDVGGLVGFSWVSTIQNCVAANEEVSVDAAYADNVNRIAGYDHDNYTNFHNNYALSTMVVKAGSVVLNKPDDDILNGTGMSKTTLQSYHFYNSGSNWYNNTAWDIANPTGIWKICDDLSYPVFRWQYLDCPYVAVNYITDVPDEAMATIPCTLTGTVFPYNATNQIIIWSVQDAGTTGAYISPAYEGGGWTLNTTGIGEVVVTATIENGATETTPYTQNFDIIVNKATQATPAAPTLNNATTTSITLDAVEGCEYNIDGEEYQTSPVFSGLTHSKTHIFTQRKAETDTHLASSVSESATFSTIEIPSVKNLLVKNTQNCVASLSWDAPDAGAGYEGYLQHCGETALASDYLYASEMEVATRFLPEDLTAYGVRNGQLITNIEFCVGNNLHKLTSMEVRIWQGGTSVEDPGILLYQQSVPNYASFYPFSWPIIELNTPFAIDVTKELWIGYWVTGTVGETFPFGMDQGPYIPQKGALRHIPEFGGWEEYPDSESNYIIRSFLYNEDGKSVLLGNNVSRLPLSYDIYCDGDKVGNTTELHYNHTVMEPDNYNFCVIAIYEENEESYEVCKDVTVACVEIPDPAVAYGYIQYPPSDAGYWKWEVDNITGKTLIKANMPTLFGGAYFDGNLYAYETASNNVVTFYIIDANTGNTISSVPRPEWNGKFINAMAFDYTTNTMFALNDRTIYTVNLTTGQLTTVAQISGTSNYFITMAINLSGNMFLIDRHSSQNANLWSVNKNTGAATLVGNTGKIAYYAQSMAFDLDTDVLYWSQFSTIYDMNWMSVNTSTGAATLLKANTYEMTSLHFQYTLSSTAVIISTDVFPTGAGTVTGGGIYEENSTVVLTAQPNTGYSFVNWTENGNQVSENPTLTFTATENRTLVANFAVITYTINLSANPTTDGTVSGGGTYNHGASVTAKAEANEGYKFVNWTENGNQVSTNASYNFTATANRTLVANFNVKPIIYTISATVNDPTLGKITPEGDTTVEEGNSITYTVTPFGSNEIMDVLVNLVSQGIITTYTFENVQSDGTIEAVFGAVGITNVVSERGITIYPNPTTGKFNVQSSKFKVEKVEIFDIYGHLVFISPFGRGQGEEFFGEVDISHFPAGIYFLRIDGKTIKIVKK